MSEAPITQINPKGQGQGQETQLQTEGLTIHQRLLAVSQDLPAIAKSGVNNEQHYKYIEANAIAATLRELFAKHGIYLKSELSNADFSDFTTPNGKKAEKVIAWFNFTFINCFDKEDFIFFRPWPGVAMDYSDKALNKAETAAQKTFLMKQFLISDVDPDLDSPEAIPNQLQQSQGKPAQTAQQNSKPQGQKPAQPSQPQQEKPTPQQQSNQAQPQSEEKQPNRMPDLTTDEFKKFMAEMKTTSTDVAQVLSNGEQKTIKEWSEAYKKANPSSNIKNWLRFALHKYTMWLQKNKPEQGWLWNEKESVPRLLEDTPFEDIPEDL